MRASISASSTAISPRSGWISPPKDASNHGRLDLRLRFNGQIWLFEFKVVELAPQGQAVQQIKDRGYAEKYRAEGLPILLIGIEFSREQRTLVGFETEYL